MPVGYCKPCEYILYLSTLRTQAHVCYRYFQPVPRPTASNVPEVKFTETPQIVTVPAPYTPLVTDSPPYTPTGPQPPHGGYANDDDLTDSYSFAPGYDMPTLAAMGSDPVTTGIPQPTYDPAPCMISTGPQAQFTILDSNFVPLISKASNQLGPIAQPTVQPSASDPLSKVNPQDITFPGFYLQQAAGGPANTYDLIYAGSTTQYVAMMSNGKIVLTGSSTGPNYINGLATTIFSTDCNGKLTISQGGQAYSWSSINGLTKAAAGGSAHMVALPKNHPAITKAKRDREENLVIARGLQEKLKRRQKLKRNEYQEGDAPKCPNNIPNLVPYLRSDYTLGEGNVCDNLPDWWQLSPFDFDKSCAVQSLCFDQCQHFGWDSCTGIFTVLAISSCAEHFSGSWWDIIVSNDSYDFDSLSSVVPRRKLTVLFLLHSRSWLAQLRQRIIRYMPALGLEKTFSSKHRKPCACVTAGVLRILVFIQIRAFTAPTSREAMTITAVIVADNVVQIQNAKRDNVLVSGELTRCCQCFGTDTNSDNRSRRSMWQDLPGFQE